MTRWLPFHWHLVEVLVVVGPGVAHHLVVRDLEAAPPGRVALLLLAAVLVWPVGDIAASVSLTVATSQRLVMMLVVAPTLLRATPTAVFERLTRPAPVDGVVRSSRSPGWPWSS